MPETTAGIEIFRVVVVDDHPIFRDALRTALTPAFKNIVIIEASSLKELDTRLEEEPDVDLVLLDLAMPGVQGLTGLLYVRAKHPQVPVVIVSATENATIVRQAIELGASGFVPKSQPLEKIREAVSTVAKGEVWIPDAIDLGETAAGDDDLISRVVQLTPQQLRVLMLLREGLLNKQIAHELGVAESTVKAHLSAIFQKLGVHNRTQVVIAASRIGAATESTFAEALVLPSDSQDTL